MKERAMRLSVLILICIAAGLLSQPLTVTETVREVSVSFPGTAKISSWKMGVSKGSGGNLSTIQVPMGSTMNMSRTTGQWPTWVPQSINWDGVAGTMSKGRENFYILAESLRVIKKTPDTVIVKISGDSPNRHYYHARTYTFTGRGVDVSGYIRPIIRFRTLGLWGFVDNNVHEFINNQLPVRASGSTQWKYLSSAGNDHLQALPSGVQYPFEAYAKIKNQRHYVLFYFDRVFDKASKSRFLFRADRNIFSILHEGTDINPGEIQNYRFRMVFGDTSLFSEEGGIVPVGNIRLGMDDRGTRIGVYPNPFYGKTLIRLMQNANIKMQSAKLQIFDIAGNLVRTSYAVRGTPYIWDAGDLPGGTYLINVMTGHNRLSKKVTLVK
jgi:hypothetical protein